MKAFLQKWTNERGNDCVNFDMDLRDYFAAKSIPAAYAAYHAYARDRGFEENWREGVAIDAYMMADAMMKARNAK